MSDSNVHQITAFLAVKDFELSLRFYMDLGFKEVF